MHGRYIKMKLYTVLYKPNVSYYCDVVGVFDTFDQADKYREK
jgi:hypothetical protein